MKLQTNSQVFEYVGFIIVVPLILNFGLAGTDIISYQWKPVFIFVYTSIASWALHKYREEKVLNDDKKEKLNKEEQAKKLEIEINKIDDMFSSYENIPQDQLERRTILEKQRDYLLFEIRKPL